MEVFVFFILNRIWHTTCTLDFVEQNIVLIAIEDVLVVALSDQAKLSADGGILI